MFCLKFQVSLLPQKVAILHFEFCIITKNEIKLKKLMFYVFLENAQNYFSSVSYGQVINNVRPQINK